MKFPPFDINAAPVFCGRGVAAGYLPYWWSMIFSENRYPPIGSWPEGMLFGITGYLPYWWSMIFSENRYPPIGSWPEGMLFGIML